MAIQIGSALNLQTSQIEQLKEKLPDLLWERKNVSPELAELINGGMDDSTAELLIELVENIKKFLSPKRYYSRDTIKNPLLDKAIPIPADMGEVRSVEIPPLHIVQQTEVIFPLHLRHILRNGEELLHELQDLLIRQLDFG